MVPPDDPGARSGPSAGDPAGAPPDTSPAPSPGSTAGVTGRADRSRRPRRAPIVVAVVVALVPTLGFAALWRWADAVASEPPPPPVPTAVPTGPPAPTLATALASFRRAPAPLADRVADEAFDEFVDLVQRSLAGVDEIAAAGTTAGDDTAGDDTAGDAACAAVSLDGREIAGVNAAAPVVPASNQKLLVAAAALEVLDPAAPLVTEIRGAEIVDGVLAGDLYLVGGGDPALLSAQLVEELGRPTLESTVFDELADQLVDAGLVRVEGDIVADGTRYDDEFLVPSWGPDITRADGGPIGALVVNGGRIFGSGIGLNPAQAAANELNRLLVARGVTVTGGNRTGATPGEGVAVLAEVESVPIGDLVTTMLLTSDNDIAEMLLKEIGHVAAGEGSRPAGMAVVRERLAAWGVTATGAVLDDGSGLSRSNAVSCRTFVELLAHAGGDSDLAAALPVAGESGTLVDQLIDTPAEGVLRAKTGTLTGVKALSGYVATDVGEVFEFSILLTGDGVDDPDRHVPVWTALVEALAQYPPDHPPLTAFTPR